jgi:hypothetical protein
MQLTTTQLEQLASTYGMGVRGSNGSLLLSAVERQFLRNVAKALPIQPDASAQNGSLQRPSDATLDNPKYMRRGRYSLSHKEHGPDWNISVQKASVITGWNNDQIVALATYGWIPAVPVLQPKHPQQRIDWRFREWELEQVSFDGTGIPKPSARCAQSAMLRFKNGTFRYFPTAYR